MKKSRRLTCIFLVNSLLLSCSTLKTEQPQPLDNAVDPAIADAASIPNEAKEKFFMEMLSVPFLPADNSHKNIACEMPIVQSEEYLTNNQIAYDVMGWEQRLPLDLELLLQTSELGRIMLIDTVYTDKGPAYRYFSNGTHNEVYEPWSSSKIFAYTGALAKMREQGVGAPGLIGEINVSDMITTIHSYKEFGTSESSSNEIATYFANIAGREYLTSLFFDKWLKLTNQNVFFRGAYGPTPFDPNSDVWIEQSTEKTGSINAFKNATDDPGYLPYRCESCGITGNKPMTTLSQAEWLKRLALHSVSSETSHPNINLKDVESLFYGVGNSLGSDVMGGMMQGISNMLHTAISKQLDNKKSASNALDDVSDGKWRIFQKIGWGPSETRGTTEIVLLAHVCLPYATVPSHSKQFTIAAQVSVNENAEENLPIAGIKMLDLLQSSLLRYFDYKHR